MPKREGRGIVSRLERAAGAQPLKVSPQDNAALLAAIGIKVTHG